MLGAGSWGTALAVHLGHIGHDVTLWGRDHALLAEMATRRANPTYLPDLTFPETVRPTPELTSALSGARLVIVAVPSHGLRLVMRAAAPHLPAGAVLVSATKGIETDTLARMSEVMTAETHGRHPVVVLSGPSLPRRWRGGFRRRWSRPHRISRPCGWCRKPAWSFFRLYASDDVAGVEAAAR